ncbi:MAG: transcription antitermination factor NusB, partial [Oscillospiraceae bacterium]
MAARSPRMTVIELLIKVSGSAYSNLALDGALSGADYDRREKAFISRLFYGVIERKLTLDHIISLYSKKPLQKPDGSVLAILETGLYQILYMDSVPDSAAVDESVKLVRKCGRASAAGFVNA